VGIGEGMGTLVVVVVAVVEVAVVVGTCRIHDDEHILHQALLPCH